MTNDIPQKKIRNTLLVQYRALEFYRDKILSLEKENSHLKKIIKDLHNQIKHETRLYKVLSWVKKILKRCML